MYERLPAELALQVMNSSEFPVSLEKAKEQREKLMAERKQFVKTHNENYVQLNSFNVSDLTIVDLVMVMLMRFSSVSIERKWTTAAWTLA